MSREKPKISRRQVVFSFLMRSLADGGRKNLDEDEPSRTAWVGARRCPAPGLMEALIRPKGESYGGTADRPNVNGDAGHPRTVSRDTRGGAGDGNRTRTVSLEGLGLRAPSSLVSGSQTDVVPSACLGAT